MFDWHIHLHVGSSIETGDEFQWNGVTFLAIQGHRDNEDLFESSFDAFCQTLDTLDHVFVELDGSFVCRGTDPVWQLDGIISERVERVSGLELKGSGDGRKIAEFVQRNIEVLVPQGKCLVCEIVAAGWFVRFDDFKSRFLMG